MSDGRITFGTDGWRAVVGDGFTFETARSVARAAAVAMREMDVPERVDRSTAAVGFDRRFISAEVAEGVAEELAAAGYRVLLADRPVPSPAVSHLVVEQGIVGGLVITASHNPAIWNGLKFKGWYGGSGLPSMYALISRSLGVAAPRGEGEIERTDFLGDYAAAIRAQLDVTAIAESGIRILHDPIHGASAGLPGLVIGEKRVETIRGEVNPAFGGVNPEPIPENLVAAHDAMRGARGAFAMAICNDGDGDRLGVLDEQGRYVSPHKIIALLTLDFARRKKLTGEVVKTFSTTRLVERIGEALGIVVHETPIGFKYVADLMLTRNVMLGGEESGGIGFGSFLPERDGVLSGLLVAEAIAATGKPLSEMIDAMEQEFGRTEYARRDIRATTDRCERLLERAGSGELDDAFGLELARRESIDGVKLSFGTGAWILFRRSGTEPLIRIYCEAPDRESVENLLERGVAELTSGE